MLVCYRIVCYHTESFKLAELLKLPKRRSSQKLLMTFGYVSDAGAGRGQGRGRGTGETFSLSCSKLYVA